jgi:hypothetical protein
MNKVETIKYLLQNSELSQTEIRALVKCRTQLVADTLKSLSIAERRAIIQRNYRNSKLGKNNPMFGKTGENHHNFKIVKGDSKGYLLRLKPEWYTGRQGSKHVFEHSAVYCEHTGMTEIPEGYVVHHCDQNKLNNAFTNLLMMTMGEHAALHRFIEGATTISKESTAKWLEARRTGNSCDIV